MEDIGRVVIFRKDLYGEVEVLWRGGLGEGGVGVGGLKGVLEGVIGEFREKKAGDEEFIKGYREVRRRRAVWVKARHQCLLEAFDDRPGVVVARPQVQAPVLADRNEPGLLAPTPGLVQNNFVNDAMQAQLLADRFEREEQDRLYQMMTTESELAEKKEKDDIAAEDLRLAQEQLKLEELENKIADMRASFAEEPLATEENVLKCVFRVPSGARMERKFLKSETYQRLWDYVFIQDEIGFEEDVIRGEFVLMHGSGRMTIDDLTLRLGDKYSQSKQALFLVNAK